MGRANGGLTLLPLTTRACTPANLFSSSFFDFVLETSWLLASSRDSHFVSERFYE